MTENIFIYEKIYKADNSISWFVVPRVRQSEWSLTGLGREPLVSLLGDRHADALTLGQGNPRLGAFTDGEDVIEPKIRDKAFKRVNGTRRTDVFLDARSNF